MSEPLHVVMLRQELERRVARNPRYSLRAFARALDLDPGLLSKVLSLHAALSVKAAARILTHLDFPPIERQHFLQSVGEAHTDNMLAQVRATGCQTTAAHLLPPDEVDIETFQVISNIHHYIVLELTYVKGFQSTPQWIASKLALHVHEVEAILDRLLALGLLEWSAGALRKTSHNLTTKDKALTTPALRQHQKQVLEHALDALENVPLDRRAHLSMTMAVDPSRLPVARKMMQEFMESLCNYLESGERTEVFQLGLCLFPVGGEID